MSMPMSKSMSMEREDYWPLYDMIILVWLDYWFWACSLFVSVSVSVFFLLSDCADRLQLFWNEPTFIILLLGLGLGLGFGMHHSVLCGC